MTVTGVIIAFVSLLLAPSLCPGLRCCRRHAAAIAPKIASVFRLCLRPAVHHSLAHAACSWLFRWSGMPLTARSWARLLRTSEVNIYLNAACRVGEIRGLGLGGGREDGLVCLFDVLGSSEDFVVWLVMRWLEWIMGFLLDFFGRMYWGMRVLLVLGAAMLFDAEFPRCCFHRNRGDYYRARICRNNYDVTFWVKITISRMFFNQWYF